MIGGYLTQTLALKRPSALAADGSRTYSEVEMPCRFEWGSRLVVNREGETVTSAARIFTTAPVYESDVIPYGGRDWRVISVSEQRGFAVSHYEVFI